MCLVNIKPELINQAVAFKVFKVGTDGKLYSPFVRNNKNYELDTEYWVEDGGEGFHSICNESDAIKFFKFMSLYNTYVLTKVTVFNVFATGYLHLNNPDSQCMDPYYKSYKSNGIIIDDIL